MCGQGEIYPVEITAAGGSRFSLCCECERMWKADDPIDPEQAVDFSAYMEERNLDAVWSNLGVLGPPLLENHAQSIADPSLADCPLCVDGRIYPVEVVMDGHPRFNICSGCERMWQVGDMMRPDAAVDFATFMANQCRSATWTDLRILGLPLLKNSLYPSVGSGDENSRL